MAHYQIAVIVPQVLPQAEIEPSIRTDATESPACARKATRRNDEILGRPEREDLDDGSSAGGVEAAFLKVNLFQIPGQEDIVNGI